MYLFVGVINHTGINRSKLSIWDFVPFCLISIGNGSNNVIIGKGRSEIIGGFEAGGLANPEKKELCEIVLAVKLA